jgi:hypothetical protein
MTVLANLLSPLRPLTWSILFYGYPRNLLVILQDILTYRTEIGLSSLILPNVYKNHLSLYNNEDLIFKNIVTNLALGCI